MKTQGRNLIEKAMAGWWDGCNSTRTQWLIPDTQYGWGVNVLNRGGIIGTRPGYRLRLTLPAGRLQGTTLFRATKTGAAAKDWLVAAVDGKVYALPYPFTQPTVWEKHRIRNLTFRSDAEMVYWCAAEKSVVQSDQGQLSIVPTYSILMIQDGATACGWWDGVASGHTVEGDKETPTGKWMVWAGNRLWVARGSAVLAGDINDPIAFTERVEGTGRGDFRFKGEVTALATTVGDNRASNVVVFTESNTETLLASVLERESWDTTANFQSILYPELGCVAGRSVKTHAGLLWWWSRGGLVSSDSAMAAFLTSAVKYKDVEMARSKAKITGSLGGVCAATHENFLLVSVPSNDTLNAHTWVLDYAVANELKGESGPAWAGVWTGIRPVEWATGFVEGVSRVFVASTDYQALSDGSFNHVWEAFMPTRADCYEVQESGGGRRLVRNRIFCQVETKLMGDGMDAKLFANAQAAVVECERRIDYRMGFIGTRGGMIEIKRGQIRADVSVEGIANADAQALDGRVDFVSQSRIIESEEMSNRFSRPDEKESVETKYRDGLDRAFGIVLQWCGAMAIEAMRMYMEPKAEEAVGNANGQEAGARLLTDEGESFIFAEEGEETGMNTPDEITQQYVTPRKARVPEVFYSSIPVAWQDGASGKLCLACARETFEPAADSPIIVDGRTIA